MTKKEEECSSCDEQNKKVAGKITAEQLTTIKDKDPRVFQDGIYITKKPVRGEA